MKSTRFCPTLEIDITGIPSYQSSTNLNITITPIIDDNLGKSKPTIVKSNIVGISDSNTKPVVYNGVLVDVGELVLIHDDSAFDNVANTNNKGELIIATKDDNVNLYSLSSSGSLNYTINDLSVI